MTIWQIAAGDGKRDYSDVFLRFGLACVGPGDPGPYFEARDEYEDRTNPAVYRPWMNAFCEEIAPDDVLILKRPTGRSWEILAAGRVTDGYAHDDRLGDVEGWDLQHRLTVEWHEPESPLVVAGLARGTLRRVHKAEPRDKAMRVVEQRPARVTDELPEPAADLKDDALVDTLIDHGAPAARAETITDTIWRVRRLARWYQRHGGNVGEHEIRTFLIVPLLTALGWPEQRVKIEFKHLDLALFDRPFGADGAELKLVIESKRLHHALGGSAVAQAQDYAERFETCRSLVVSDGFRYLLMDRFESFWSPEAYANLLKLKDRHPYEEGIAGADELFLRLLP